MRHWIDMAVSLYEDAQQLVRSSPLDNPAFRAWFGDSKVVDDNGQPKIVYHGTTSDFDAFRRPGRRGSGGNAIFFATDPATSNNFTHMQPGAKVIPCYVRMEHPFDFRNSKDAARLKKFVTRDFAKIFPGALFGPGLACINVDEGDYGVLEKPLVMRWMRRNGYDGFWTRENRWGALTLAVFDPRQVKSAIGNQGTFNRDDPRLTEQIMRCNEQRSP